MTYNTAREAAEAYAKDNPNLTSYPDGVEIELSTNDISDILEGKTLWETESGNEAFIHIQENLRDALEYDIKTWDGIDENDFEEHGYDHSDIVEEAWDLFCAGKIDGNDEQLVIEQSPAVELAVILHEDNTNGTEDRSEEAVKALQEQLPFNVSFDALYEAVQETPSDFREVWMLVSVPLAKIDTEWNTLTVHNPLMYLGNALMGGFTEFKADGPITVDREDVLASIAWKEEYESNEAEIN